MTVASREPAFHDTAAWDVLVRLAGLRRAPGSAGETAAAELIERELAQRGARARVEPVAVHGTYWIPIGVSCAAATAGSAGGRLGALVAAAACLSVVDDLSIGTRPLRRLLGRRTARNVIGEYGSVDAERTLLICAHHDAAHTGLVFHPAGAKLAARLAGGLIERVGGTPAPMWGAAAGPAAVAIGGLIGAHRLRHLGAALSAGYAAAMLDIWSCPPVPGANDNLSGICALLAIAAELQRRPPRRLRVMLVSTGSEESFLEAMVAFGTRHFPQLPRDSTTFLCLESVGSPQLMLLSGEGLLRRKRYPQALIDELSQLAARAGIALRSPFRYRLATDGQVPLRAGYRTAVISSMDWYKAPSNYHWPSDRPNHLDRTNVFNAARLALALIDTLDPGTGAAPAHDGVPAISGRDRG
jgi:Peptidase family M28